MAFAAAAAGIGSRASYGARTTADEPHYLLTALSIAHDGDLDVRDEFARMEYLPFHEIPLDPQAAPRADGSLIEPHDPLLPVVLAAPAALGGWVLAKLTLAAVAAALAALLVWTPSAASACPSGGGGRGGRASPPRRRSRPTARRSTPSCRRRCWSRSRSRR